MAKAAATTEITTDDTTTKFDKAFDSGWTVRIARVHQPVTLMGITSGKTISDTKLPGLEMSWTAAGLLMRRKGQRGLIPTSNVADIDI